MGLFGWISGMFSGGEAAVATHEVHGDLSNADINPASGLPMVDGPGGVDVAGNLYGSDAASEAMSSIDDSFSHDSFSHDSFDSDMGGGFGGW